MCFTNVGTYLSLNSFVSADFPLKKKPSFKLADIFLFTGGEGGVKTAAEKMTFSRE